MVRRQRVFKSKQGTFILTKFGPLKGKYYPDKPKWWWCLKIEDYKKILEYLRKDVDVSVKDLNEKIEENDLYPDIFSYEAIRNRLIQDYLLDDRVVNF